MVLKTCWSLDLSERTKDIGDQDVLCSICFHAVFADSLLVPAYDLCSAITLRYLHMYYSRNPLGSLLCHVYIKVFLY
jgi:hypothetical protein